VVILNSQQDAAAEAAANADDAQQARPPVRPPPRRRHSIVNQLRLQLSDFSPVLGAGSPGFEHSHESVLRQLRLQVQTLLTPFALDISASMQCSSAGAVLHHF